MTKTIYLAGGCFWGTEAFFKLLRGVTATSVGYANGRTDNPTYEAVCRDNTGHAETVRIDYDADVLALPLILDLYYATIDPTSVNKQGGDIGEQYRTGIYYIDEEDRPIIEASLEELSQRYRAPIVVECQALEQFFPAEDYHQDYLDKNPTGYCHIRPELFLMARNANPAPKD